METSKTFRRSGPLAHLDSLPEELILKIVKFCGTSKPDGKGKGAIYDHNFILAVFRKISKRFRRISADSSLWRGSISIKASQEDVSFAINHCIHSGTKILKVRTVTGEDVSTAEIMAIYKRCHKLKGLDLIVSRGTWPALPSPWSSLRVLSLHLPKVIPNPEFGCHEFHEMLPNLKVLAVCTPKPYSGYCR